jgi:uncharacterized protein YcsI (UPF0317 family)
MQIRSAARILATVSVPLFWACGVTPEAVIEAARPPFCITHRAGHMLVIDRLNEEFRES